MHFHYWQQLSCHQSYPVVAAAAAVADVVTTTTAVGFVVIIIVVVVAIVVVTITAAVAIVVVAIPDVGFVTIITIIVFIAIVVTTTVGVGGVIITVMIFVVVFVVAATTAMGGGCPILLVLYAISLNSFGGAFASSFSASAIRFIAIVSIMILSTSSFLILLFSQQAQFGSIGIKEGIFQQSIPRRRNIGNLSKSTTHIISLANTPLLSVVRTFGIIHIHQSSQHGIKLRIPIRTATITTTGIIILINTLERRIPYQRFNVPTGIAKCQPILVAIVPLVVVASMIMKIIIGGVSVGVAGCLARSSGYHKIVVISPRDCGGLECDTPLAIVIVVSIVHHVGLAKVAIRRIGNEIRIGNIKCD
mmetsp:Transcript_43352/g.91059  ORF Transcript_43352/g.91059 Transcript_43352/m.91059 type:complete len:361 (-) Transcript_43352:238-1320(-)